MRIFKDTKGLPPVLILAILFASCGQHYSNDIGDRLKAQSCKMMPINDSLTLLDSLGYIAIIPTDGNPMVCDSIYTVDKTWWQAWQEGKKDGSVLIVWIALPLMVIFIGLFIHTLENQRQSDGKAPLGWLVPIFICAIAACFALEWDHWNSTREIRKQDYIEYIQKDGDLRNFWTTPAKDY